MDDLLFFQRNSGRKGTQAQRFAKGNLQKILKIIAPEANP